MSDWLRVRVTGPLEPFAAGFSALLRVEGDQPCGALEQLYLMAHLSRWLAGEELGAASLDTPTVERFVGARRRAGYAHHRSARALRLLLGYLRGLGAAPSEGRKAPAGPVEELLWRYERYLVLERGLKAASAEKYISALRPFLRGLRASGSADVDLRRLDVEDVRAFVVGRPPGVARGWGMTELRSFLGFLYWEGTIERPLKAAVPSVAAWRLASLPKDLAAAEVDKLLGSCEQRTALGRRDFAILTVLARLGLRTGEVARLLLEDIDWRAGEITVAGKGARRERLPLPADVGETIAEYLRRGRPDAARDRCVFVRARAPHRGLSSGAVGGSLSGLPSVPACRVFTRTGCAIPRRAGCCRPARR